MKKVLSLSIFLIMFFVVMADASTIALLPIKADNCTDSEREILKIALMNAINNGIGYDLLIRDSDDIDNNLWNKSIEGSNIFDDKAQTSPIKWIGADYVLSSKIYKEGDNDLANYTISVVLNDTLGIIKVSAREICVAVRKDKDFFRYKQSCENLAQRLKEELLKDIKGRIWWESSEDFVRCSELLTPGRNALIRVDNAWNTSTRYTNEMRDKCSENISLFWGYTKNGQYQDAYEYWENVYYHCPDMNMYTYIAGEKILKHYIERAETEYDWNRYFNLLMEVYDKWIYYFGEDTVYSRAYIQGKKGEFISTYKQETEEKLKSYYLLRSSVMELKQRCCVKLLYDFYSVSSLLFEICQEHKEDFDNDFTKVKMYLEEKVNSNDNDTIQTILNLIETDYASKRHYSFPSRKTIKNFSTHSLVCEESREVVGPIFVVVEENPEFPGGADAMSQFINAHLKYPTIAKENNIQGRVIVSFVVEKDGSITDVKVVKSVDSSLDQEAIRVVSIMPKWKPGKQRGKTVRVSYTIHFNFKIGDEESQSSQNVKPTEFIYEQDFERQLNQGYLEIGGLYVSWPYSAAMTLRNTRAYLQSFNNNKFRNGGWSDWRCPTKEEAELIKSIIKRKYGNINYSNLETERQELVNFFTNNIIFLNSIAYSFKDGTFHDFYENKKAKEYDVILVRDVE